MKQERIMELLKEAAEPKCPPVRLNEIRDEFDIGFPKLQIRGEGAAEALYLIGVCLFTSTVEHCREKLPSLFPVFAMIYGDHADNVICANTNWLLA